MNTRDYMVIIKGEIKTSQIMSCVYNQADRKWDVEFNNGKTYSYAYLNVEMLGTGFIGSNSFLDLNNEGMIFLY